MVDKEKLVFVVNANEDLFPKPAWERQCSKNVTPNRACRSYDLKPVSRTNIYFLWLLLFFFFFFFFAPLPKRFTSKRFTIAPHTHTPNDIVFTLPMHYESKRRKKLK